MIVDSREVLVVPSLQGVRDGDAVVKVGVASQLGVLLHTYSFSALVDHLVNDEWFQSLVSPAQLFFHRPESGDDSFQVGRPHVLRRVKTEADDAIVQQSVK